MAVEGEPGPWRRVEPRPLQQGVHLGAAVAAAVRGADRGRVEERREEVVRVERVGLPAQQGEVEVTGRGERDLLGPGLDLAGPYGQARLGEVLLQAGGHSQGLGQVGTGRAGHREDELAAGTRGDEDPPRGLPVEQEVAGLRVVADEAGRQDADGRLGVARHHPHEGGAVDRAGQGLPHPRVVERRALVVDREVDEVEARPRVERQPPHRAQGGHVARVDGGRHVGGPVGERAGERVRAGEAAVDDAVDPRRAAPVVGVRGEDHLARPGSLETEGPRPDRRRGRVVQATRALERVEGLGERGQEARVRPVEGELHDEGADALGPSREGPLPPQMLDVPHHRVGVERRAVVEDDALAQGEGPDALVERRPGDGEGAFRLQGARADPHERVAHVGHDLGREDVGRPVGLERVGIGQRSHDDLARARRQRRGEKEGAQHQRGRRAPW